MFSRNLTPNLIEIRRVVYDMKNTDVMTSLTMTHSQKRHKSENIEKRSRTPGVGSGYDDRPYDRAAESAVQTIVLTPDSAVQTIVLTQ
jgi:hypothetical protein